MVKHTREPGTPGAPTAASPSQPVAGHDNSGRPRLFVIAMGALDAHLNQVDFFDTVGGNEVLRLYHRRRAVHQAHKGPHETGKQAPQAA